ncbi:MAG: LamG domain-containing protein, partial [Planctomycetota bacterium]
RETLDPASKHAFMAVTPEPSHGLAFQYRDGVDLDDSDSEHGVDNQTAPYWVRLVRQGNQFTGYHSPDGINWTIKDASGVEDDAMNPVTIPMFSNVYIGLALTSHDDTGQNVLCVGQFSDVSTSGFVTGAWQVADIGTIMPEEGANDPEPMYVAISNSNGTTGTVYYEDNDNIDTNATLIDTWTQWNIDLKDFQDQGVNLADVNSVAIGIGTRGSTTPGGAGKMYFEDIVLYRPRYIPGKGTQLEADLNDDGVVDFRDLEIMTNDWLMGDFTRPGPLLVNYKFDEATGIVAIDSSVHGNDGTFSGTATWAMAGKMGAAASFDGGVGEVRGANTYLNGLSALSFGAWIKSNVIGTDAGVIIFAEPTGNDQCDIRYDSAGAVGGGTNLIKYGVATEEGSHENESASNVQTTEWQHIMVTWNSGEAAKLYINGVLDTPVAEDDIIGGTTTGYTTLLVGRGSKDDAGSWDGLVDDVRVYDVALTAAEVQTVMNGGDLSVVDVYVPLRSPANIYDEEPANSKKVNFKDQGLYRIGGSMAR